MTTVTVKFRPSEVAGRKGRVYYQIRHLGLVRQISTNVRLSPEEWKNERIYKGWTPEQIHDEKHCISIRQPNVWIIINTGLQELRRIIRILESRSSPYTSDDVVIQFRRPENRMSILNYFDEQIRNLIAGGKSGTAINYRRTAQSIYHFLNHRDISLSALDESFVLAYEEWLTARGISRNTSSFYLRVLRAVYNKAVARRMIEQTHPFEHAYTGIDKTGKRALNETAILNLSILDLCHSPTLDLARDLFVFSYCTRGMTFVDMAYLRKQEIEDGFIVYNRHKTGQPLTVRIEPCIERILKKYENTTRFSPFVFPLIKSEETETAYRQYRTALSIYNRRLKRLARLAGITVPLTSYVARHTWATTARNHHIPISVISAGMGHTSEKTTQIYLASLENTVIDRANRGLLSALNERIAYHHTSTAFTPNEQRKQSMR